MFHLVAFLQLCASNPWEISSYNEMWEVGRHHEITWAELRKHMLPGQHVLGHAWVMEKRDQMGSSISDARVMFKNRVIPTILTDRGLVAVSSHHFLVALEEVNHPQWWQHVYLNMTVVCDFRNLSERELMQNMRDHQMLYPFYREKHDWKGIPLEHHSMTLDDLPTRWKLRDFEDDPWRSLVAFINTQTDKNCPKNNPYCYRCYDVICYPGDPVGHQLHQDFQFARYLNEAARKEWYHLPYYATKVGSDWSKHHLPPPSEKQDPHKSPLLKFYMDGPPENDHYAAWMALARKISPYCHSKDAGKYEMLPFSMSFTGMLNGWTNSTYMPKVPRRCEPNKCPVKHYAMLV